MSLSGGAPVVICAIESPWGASWGADGTVLFGQRVGIMRVSAAGGTPELVIPAEDGEQVYGPQLLPDGDSVLFSVTNSAVGADGNRWDEGMIVVQSIASGQRRTVLEGGSDAQYVSTGHLVYALQDGLFAVAFDPDNFTVKSAPVSLVQGVARAIQTGSANYGVSDQGTLFYLAGDIGRSISRLAWVDEDGTAEIIQTIPANAYMVPRLSPDGERVLVWAEGDWRVYDLASGRESRVTTDGEALPYGDWSPTAPEVAYSSTVGGQGPGQVNIRIQPLDGSDVARQLTQLDGELHFDSWAPDGRTLAAHHHRVGSLTNLLTVNVDGTDSEPQGVLERQFRDLEGVFSPDGRYLAYISDETGQRELYIRPFREPGGPTPVSVGGAIEPAWAPTGELFYRRLDDYRMMVVSVSTDPALDVAQPTELFSGRRGPPGAGLRARYAVTADGRRFLLSADLLPSAEAATRPVVPLQVNVVINWFEELKARVPIP